MVESDYNLKKRTNTMRCISPLKASLDRDGNITHSSKKAIQGLQAFEFECRKCLPCRLNIAREKAIRCMHEAKMHENNIFLTLTYTDKYVPHRLTKEVYKQDFGNFMKRLRHTTSNKISLMVTGEYGDLKKRPHWHAILFNYMPEDATYHYTTDLGHRILKSATIDELWGMNDPETKPNEIGSVTMDSAGYVARYAAKKLIHGKDQDHDYHPIHKTSSANAIGKSWIEKYWKHTFENGFVTLPNGQITKIPRYYTDWLKKNKPDEYLKYVTGKREEIQKLAERNARKEELEYLSNIITYKGGCAYPTTRAKVKETILQSKFKKLQEHLKL